MPLITDREVHFALALIGLESRSAVGRDHET